MNAKLQDLQARKEQAFNAGSPRSVERQHEKGKLLARERINALHWCQLLLAKLTTQYGSDRFVVLREIHKQH